MVIIFSYSNPYCKEAILQASRINLKLFQYIHSPGIDRYVICECLMSQRSFKKFFGLYRLKKKNPWGCKHRHYLPDALSILLYCTIGWKLLKKLWKISKLAFRAQSLTLFNTVKSLGHHIYCIFWFRHCFLVYFYDSFLIPYRLQPR